jgi:phenylacetate-CoA ligase
MGAPPDRDRAESWSDDERRAYQWGRLSAGLPELLRSNAFYRARLERAGIRGAAEIRELGDLPFLTKAELSQDQADHPPFGSNLTYPPDRYTRLHQTSGTTGRPLRVLDTAESWQWWRDCWRPIYQAAGVRGSDRVFFAFSFGPFVGFWSAFAGAEQLGALCVTGGAMSTAERAAAIVATEATVLMCTPTYALRLAETARGEGIDLTRSALRVSIHAGEPGASIPATRERIERELGVTAFDHTGATEVGAHGFSCEARDGVHLNEAEFIAEIVDAGQVRDEGDGELVMTNLGRWGMPAIRYRTGDRVHGVRGQCSCGRTFLKLAGGIIGRVDDMVTVRGVNVFPSAIEAIIRRFDGIAEFRVTLITRRGMDELLCTLEPRGDAPADVAERVANGIHGALGIRCSMEVVAPGTLPRFELKANRFVRRGEDARGKQ